MQRLADYVAKFLLDYGVKDIFMLTGYGAMYLNDAIELSGINYYATRNEATAPMMAEAYARLTGKLGVVCVTAGPGATNALPGLAEAWVDSAPILISGQVERRHTTYCSNTPGLRTFGTAEINIIPIVKPITKFAAIVDNENDIRYLLEKSVYMATEGRPGPVWLDIPLDIQQVMINPLQLNGFCPVETKLATSEYCIDSVIDLLESSQRPLIVAGHGVRQGHAINELINLVELLKVPVIFSRLGQDLMPHSHPYVFGQAGIKGSRYCKKLMNSADLVIALGSRLAPQFVGYKFDAFSNATIVAVDIEECELKKPGIKINVPICADVKGFLKKLVASIDKSKLPGWQSWLLGCDKLKQDNPMITSEYHRNPIDLYYFMSRLDAMSNENHVFVTDAGSNYYAGGQVWKFDRGQREICSGTNAAMGTTIPLAIGCAIAAPDYQILAVTGDGSLELNIQELKTISHYNLNIKLFVINNGGYVSMKKWQDMFDGRRIDTEEETGTGTLDLKKIAVAFGLNHYQIDDFALIDKQLKEVMSDNRPLFVEVMTDHKQKIVEAFKDA
jgi:acetolactate synthase I/II/III large subunit